jgi:hypothetical protein
MDETDNEGLDIEMIGIVRDWDAKSMMRIADAR